MASLIEHVRSNIEPTTYYTSVFPDVIWAGGSDEARINCCFHEDHATPSLHMNSQTGQWYCHGCEAGGKSIVSFHAKLNNVSQGDAARELFEKFIHPIISDKTIRKWHRRLRETPSMLSYLKTKRFLSDEVINKYQLGFNGIRLTIPIRNEFGICVNVKSYDPLHKQHRTPKMFSYGIKSEPRAFGRPSMLFPIAVLGGVGMDEKVFICEGEWDTLALLSLGIPAVTTTNGSKSWPKQYNWLFLGKEAIIAYDNDQDGMMYDRKLVLKHLSKFVRRARRVHIPKQVGKDVTDWLSKSSAMRNKQAWYKVAQKADLMLENPDEVVEKNKTVIVTLDEASKSQCFNRRIQVDAMITGKDAAPYLLPKKFRASCDKSCDECPFAEATQDYRECKIETNDPRVLKMLDSNETTIRKTMLDMVGLQSKASCKATIDVLETFNIEQVILTPTIAGGTTTTAKYVMRSAYYVGHGIVSNRTYTFEGLTLPHPRDQHSTHLFDKATAVQGEVETFNLTSEIKRSLAIFRPKAKESIYAHLQHLADWQSRNVTKIRERPDLHIAVDLVFHSLFAFHFNDEYLRRGMLDALILGDTRCGKGYVAEGLTRYYGLGEVVSGEMCSFAGLIGGLQQVDGKKWLVTWGAIPLNHARAVVIDEASAIPIKDMSEMSRVRSEGVAELSMIRRESTQANTRLLWLSNTRSGRKLDRYNWGVEAIMELMGANEDVSRFDFAMTVAANEVASTTINTVQTMDTHDSAMYPRELCRALILWAWSRRPDQIKFTEQATREIIHQAIQFGERYSPNIPLVQGENIRIKLAKISAAVAARVFSSDETGEKVIIDRQHVLCACQFIQELYEKPSMGYDAYSHRAIESTKPIPGASATPTEIDRLFHALGNDAKQVIRGLLELHRITPDSFGDYVGDTQAARSIIGDLVRLNCISRIEPGGWYLKNPSFTTWLRLRSNPNGQHQNTDRPGRRYRAKSLGDIPEHEFQKSQ